MNPEGMIRELKEKGFKLTPQRMEIVRALYNFSGDHPSLNSLHDYVTMNMPTVSFSTLYNTISTLEKNGMIRLFDYGGETRIEMNLEDHLNIIDTETGKITDLKNEKMIEEVLTQIDMDNSRERKVLINVIYY